MEYASNMNLAHNIFNSGSSQAPDEQPESLQISKMGSVPPLDSFVANSYKNVSAKSVTISGETNRSGRVPSIIKGS